MWDLLLSRVAGRTVSKKFLDGSSMARKNGVKRQGSVVCWVLRFRVYGLAWFKLGTRVSLYVFFWWHLVVL